MTITPDLARSCRFWTRAVLTFFYLMLTAVIVSAALAPAITRKISPEQEFSVTVILVANWVIWVSLHYSNYQLIRFGPQADRQMLAPAWINSPVLAVRLLNHFVINWSAIILTLAIAHLIESSSFRTAMAWFSIAMTTGTWISFNMLHRKFNRLRNLLLSSAIAGFLYVSSGLIIVLH